MFRYVTVGSFCILLGCVAQGVAAEPPGQDNTGDGLASIADDLFADFFAETESEREIRDAVTVTKEEELRVGRADLDSFLDSLRRRNIKVAQRGNDASYLKSLATEIHPLMRNSDRYPSINVYVAQLPTTDARAFPGGFIVCSTGLIEFAQSEAALIGVLAHEMSHIDRGHQLRILRNIKLADNTFSSTDLGLDDLAKTGRLLFKQFARPFRPEEEAEADLDAAKWVIELGYDPLEFALLFRRMHQRDAWSQSPMPSFLRMHPYHGERYHAVRKLSLQLNAVQPKQELYVGQENLRKRITRRQQSFAE